MAMECPSCNGSGRAPGDRIGSACRSCGGTGELCDISGLVPTLRRVIAKAEGKQPTGGQAHPTPGPWRVTTFRAGYQPDGSNPVDYSAIMSNEGQIATISEECHTNRESNAPLIAAAPDLLAALKVLTMDERIRPWLAENDPKALGQAHAAILKAEEQRWPRLH